MKPLEQLLKLLPKQKPPATSRINSFFVITLIAPIAAPADNEPVSPINIFAGGALNHKKPNPAPIKLHKIQLFHLLH